MYSVPSGRRKGKNEHKRLNLIPILDSVFILIFFLLLSASFLKIFEINSNVPIVSSKPPPPRKTPPLGLTLEIKKAAVVVLVGEAPQKTLKRFAYNEDEQKYPVEEIHSFLIDLKKKHTDENTVVLEPDQDIAYDDIVQIMDAARILKKTDDEIYTKDKDGLDVRLEYLFDDIIFGNITS